MECDDISMRPDDKTNDKVKQNGISLFLWFCGIIIIGMLSSHNFSVLKTVETCLEIIIR